MQSTLYKPTMESNDNKDGETVEGYNWIKAEYRLGFKIIIKFFAQNELFLSIHLVLNPF